MSDVIDDRPGAAGRRAQLISRIHTERHRVAAMHDGIRVLYAAASQREHELNRSLTKLTGIEYPSIGSWPCKSSPIGVCIYDDNADPMHDCCPFCNDPEERK